MLDLLIAILSTTGIAVLLRLTRQYRRSTEVVIATNYVVASLIGWVLLLASDSPLTARPSTIALGLCGGLLWPASFHLYSWGIATFGIARTGAWSRLSVGVPVLLGVAVLGEGVDRRLLVGLMLFAAAFAALTPRLAQTTAASRTVPIARRHTMVYAVALILVFGVIDAWISVFNEVADGTDQVAFFVLLFTSAAVVSWATLLLRRPPVHAADFVAGALLGLLNFGVAWFLLRAISGRFENDTAIAYSLFSATSLVLMVAIGRVAWKEQVRSRDLIGIAAALAAIAVLNQ